MDVGCRVVRGTDWEWDDQDGGEGCIGTVVEGMQNTADTVEGTVWIQWDAGDLANYRAGLDDKTDLLVYDSSGKGVTHNTVICDGCSRGPLVGMRWKCAECHDFDLCTSCYMADTHDVDCTFSRIDSNQGNRVEVGKREGATKVQAKGIFSGARVHRGPDWHWGDQDGGKGGQGSVTEIKDWKKAGVKCGVTVKWDHSNRENTYRLGYEGKVDLIATTMETGGFYYKDHLPGLRVRPRKTVSGFTTGDKVKVSVTKKELVKLAERHGGWNNDMEECIPKIGVVYDFTKSGDVIVEYETVKWRFVPQAITKFREFRSGDKVLVSSDQEHVMNLQVEHGGWNSKMKTMLGMIATVKKLHTNGDVIIKVEEDIWLVNSAILTLHEAGKEGEDSDDEMEDPLSSLFKQQFTLQKILAEAFSEMFTDVDNDNSGNHKEDKEIRNLVQAAGHGHLSRVTQILDSNPDLINGVFRGKTCLHHACHSGCLDILKLLLEKKADTTITDSQGYTAIHHAAYGDKTGEALKLLLAHGVDPNIANNEGKCTPLHLAVRETNDNAVRILVQHETCNVNLQDDKGECPLHDAIHHRSNSIVDLILDAPQLNLTHTNQRGFNVLQLAAFKGNSHAARKLLSKSPELVNAAKDDGFTPLHLSAVNDHCDIAEILMEQPDCKVDCVTKNHQTPLMLAVHEGYLKMVQILKQHGADVNAADEDGDTPLHMSLMREKFFASGMGKVLCLTGLSNDSASFVEVSKYLISQGANLRLTNKAGRTPMDFGMGTEVEKDLKKAYADSKQPEKPKQPATKMNIVNNFGAEKGDEQEISTEPHSEEGNKSMQIEDEFENTSETTHEVPKASSQNNKTQEKMDIDEEKDTALLVSQESDGDEFQNSKGGKEFENVVESEGDLRQLPVKKPKMSCLVCVDAEANIVFKPCGHAIMCEGCATRAKRCPQCKAMVTSKTTEDGMLLKDQQELGEKLETVEKKLRKLEETTTCCVCLQRKKNMIFTCGHGACQVCAEQLGACAICKKGIQNKIAMF